MDTVKLFCGFDAREAVGFSVFANSVIAKSSLPVEIIPLTEQLGRKLGIATDGTNAFTKIRYAIPAICGFSGHAIFADGIDMLCRSDIAELWGLRDEWSAVQRVAHDYSTQHPRKYLGTHLEAENKDYPMKNQSSLMIFNCGHYANRLLKPAYIAKTPGADMHRFHWISEKKWLTELPKEWNHLVGEDKPNPDAKIAHFTLGIAGFNAYRGVEFADEWRAAWLSANEGLQYDITLRRSA